MLPCPFGRLALVLVVTDLTVFSAKLKDLNGPKMTKGEATLSAQIIFEAVSQNEHPISVESFFCNNRVSSNIFSF